MRSPKYSVRRVRYAAQLELLVRVSEARVLFFFSLLEVLCELTNWPSLLLKLQIDLTLLGFPASHAAMATPLAVHGGPLRILVACLRGVIGKYTAETSVPQ